MKSDVPHPVPRLVAWELTRRCNLRCAHCRAAASSADCPGELSAAEGRALIDDIAASFGPVILILTGGEPLLSPRLPELAAYAASKGLVPALGTNGTLLDAGTAARLAGAGVRRISVSVDFPDAARHEAFRGVRGAFDDAVRGIRNAIAAGLEVQINSTLTRQNRDDLRALHDLAVRLGAVAFHPFLLVPTGRGAGLSEAEMSAAEYELTLREIAELARVSPLEIKPTDAPQYRRVCSDLGDVPVCRGRGCLAGTGFVFVGYDGEVRPCGYFDLRLGNVRETPLGELWRSSPVLDDLRHPERLKGKCGLCEYRAVCGGCRARALAKSGDYLASEPNCVHIPRLVDVLQNSFPLTERPYAEIARRCRVAEDEVLAAVGGMLEAGVIRRIGPVYDSRALGRVTTLAAVKTAPGFTETVAAAIGDFPEVTHNYLRDHEFPVWFTVTAADRGRVEEILATVRGAKGVLELAEFPAERLFKLNAVFPGTSVPPAACGHRSAVSPSFPGDLAAVRAGLAEGSIKRFGAVFDPRRLGFRASALTVWPVADDDMADRFGAVLSASSAVTHCYLRRAGGPLPRSVYAMVHARDEGELGRLLDGFSRETGVEPVVLRTRGEYKKTPVGKERS